MFGKREGLKPMTACAAFGLLIFLRVAGAWEEEETSIVVDGSAHAKRVSESKRSILRREAEDTSISDGDHAVRKAVGLESDAFESSDKGTADYWPWSLDAQEQQENRSGGELISQARSAEEKKEAHDNNKEKRSFSMEDTDLLEDEDYDGDAALDELEAMNIEASLQNKPTPPPPTPAPFSGTCYKPWGEWGACSLSCGAAGTKVRTRTRMDISCIDALQQTDACQLDSCPVDCFYVEWSPWTPCTLSCGSGTENKDRTENGPFYNGQKCADKFPDEHAIGLSVQRSCNDFSCPVNCQLEHWSDWGACDKSCTGGDTGVFGVKLRDRAKIGPFHGGWSSKPLFGQPGLTACDDGHTAETSICNTHYCPIDCVLTGLHDWGPWSTCTQTCSVSIVTHGTQKRSRTAYPPMHGGKPCAEHTQLVHCNMHLCAFDCYYSPWGAWGPCSKTCTAHGEAVGERIRVRDRVGPAMDGAQCAAGDVVQSYTCNDVNCPIDCKWDDWGAYGGCSKSCAAGGQTKTRTQISAQYGGAECPPGPHNHAQVCNGFECPIDCRWTLWEAWEPCSKSCGRGSARRSRSTDPKPQNGGEHCPGPHMEMIECNVHDCPIDCSFESWLDWDLCSVSCGNYSTRTRSRLIQVVASHGGSPCNGSVFHQEPCASTGSCPVDCRFDEWSEWGKCNMTCGLKEGEIDARGKAMRLKTRVLLEAENGGSEDAPEGALVQAESCEQMKAQVCGLAKAEASPLGPAVALKILVTIFLAKHF